LEADIEMPLPLCRYEHHYQSALLHEKSKAQHQQQLDASDDINVKNNLILEIDKYNMLLKESQKALCFGFFSQEKHKLFREQNQGMWIGKNLELQLSTSEDIALARQAKANAQAIKILTECENKSKRPISTIAPESDTQRVNKHKSRVYKSLF